MMDAETNFGVDEFAADMEERCNAEARDVQIELGKKECALGMEKRSNDAVVRDVRVKLRLRMESCATGTRKIIMQKRRMKKASSARRILHHVWGEAQTMELQHVQRGGVCIEHGRNVK